jgi:hypothetical protein
MQTRAKQGVSAEMTEGKGIESAKLKEKK